MRALQGLTLLGASTDDLTRLAQETIERFPHTAVAEELRQGLARVEQAEIYPQQPIEPAKPTPGSGPADAGSRPGLT